MSKRVVVITGASAGLGRAAARVIGERGDHVAVVGRNAERTRAAAADAGGEAYVADFDRLDDVRALASALLDRYDRIDVLANNAGGLVSEWALTADGHERTFQGNVLAPFLLTELLRPRLIATAASAEVTTPVRILATASVNNVFGGLRLDDIEWAERPYRRGWPAYSASKLAVILWIRELAAQLTGTGVSAYSFHPGVVVSNFGSTSRLIGFAKRWLGSSWARTPLSGAEPLIAYSDTLPMNGPSGSYFSRFTYEGPTTPASRDPELRGQLWALLSELAGVADVADVAEVAGLSGDD